MYVPLFRTGSPDVLLNFITILHKIIRGQDLSTEPQQFGMMQNLVIGESLILFEQKAQERGAETNAIYKLLMKDLISHFFPPKALQRQKRYLRRGMYKPRVTKIRYLISHIDNIFEYLKKFPPFRAGKRLPEDDILKLVEFSPPKQWEKELIIQGFDSATQVLAEIVNFCERLETAE